jgi:repressor LexA
MSATTRPLTGRQAAIVDAVTVHIRDHGYPPTVREIGTAIGMRSTSGVAWHLERLVARGHLVRTEGKARTLALPEQETTA